MRSSTSGPTSPDSPGPGSIRPREPTVSLGSPSLSVLVTAWRRQRFLPEALRSLEVQTLPKESFEIVVVRDFEDPSLDRQLARLGARDLRFGSDNLGRTMALGIRACRGDVICFLDDDDRFDPRKLGAVRVEFGEHRDLGYFHNGLSLMNEESEPLAGNDPDLDARARRMSRDWDFCMSCISIRREIVLPLLDRWPEVPKAPDTFLDYVSRVSNYGRRRTLEPLTVYRIHSRSSSQRTNHAPALLSTARILSSLPRSRRRNAAMSSLLGRYMSAAVRGRSADRKSAVWAMAHLLASGTPSEFRPDAREVACGSLIPFSPRAAHRLYALLRKGEVDWLPKATPYRLLPSDAKASPEAVAAPGETSPPFLRAVDGTGRSAPLPSDGEDFEGLAAELRALNGDSDGLPPALGSRPR